MNKSKLFTRAHQIARNTVAQVGNYMIALSLALKELYSMTTKTAKSAEQQLIELGGKLWEKGSMRRVYISLDIANKISGLDSNLNEKYHKFYYDNGNIYSKNCKKSSTTLWGSFDGQNFIESI